jgi:hypothetical protein
MLLVECDWKRQIFGVAELMYDIPIESKIDENNEHRARGN